MKLEDLNRAAGRKSRIVLPWKKGRRYNDDVTQSRLCVFYPDFPALLSLSPLMLIITLRTNFDKKVLQQFDLVFPHFLLHMEPMFKEERQFTYKGKTEMRSRDHFCCAKARTIAHFLSKCSFCSQHVKRMRSITLSSVVCLVLPYFYTLSHKQHDFRKKGFAHKMCVLIFFAKFSYSEGNSARYFHKCANVFV